MGYPDAERKFHSANDPGENCQRIIMCGQRWSGKTSIIKVRIGSPLVAVALIL
jgi:hypothetical protein